MQMELARVVGDRLPSIGTCRGLKEGGICEGENRKLPNFNSLGRGRSMRGKAWGPCGVDAEGSRGRQERVSEEYAVGEADGAGPPWGVHCLAVGHWVPTSGIMLLPRLRRIVSSAALE